MVPALTIGFPLLAFIFRLLSKTPEEKRRQVLSDFDQAMDKINNKKPSTKDLEKWFSKNL